MYYELPDYSGPFKDVMPEYIAYMRGLGYDYGKPILYRLREIDLFFKQHGVLQTEITEDIFELWEKKRSNEGEINQRRRTNMLIAFSKYLVFRGFDNVFIGVSARKMPQNNFIPYIFSKEEIFSLTGTLKRWTAAKLFDCETAAFAVMIALFYGCGLRKTEVQKLKVKDIDLSSGTIRIMDSKNHKSRMVVASESLKRQLSKYCGLFCNFLDSEAYLFHNGEGAMFSNGKLYNRYRKLLMETSIHPRENGRLPRIHDLRHTFCVHALEEMGVKGYDLYTSLPLLVAYLGHKCVSETEYYLRLVEQNFKSVTTASHKYAPELFPKVGERK
jgi:integrase